MVRKEQPGRLLYGTRCTRRDPIRSAGRHIPELELLVSSNVADIVSTFSVETAKTALFSSEVHVGTRTTSVETTPALFTSHTCVHVLAQ